MADEKTPARAQVHLPTAPEGWEYKVTLDGPVGHSVTIEPGVNDYKVTLTTADGEQSTRENDLKGALKAGVDAAKAINRLETRKKALEAEQAAASSIFGKSAPKEDAVEPKTGVAQSPAVTGGDAADQPPLA